MIRQLRVAVLSGLFLLSSLAMVRSARAQSAPPNKPIPPEPVMDQMTDIPYFTLRDGMNSTLTLNNIGPTSTPVTVTIYNTEGKGQTLKPITLAPHSFKQIELRDVVVGDDFDSGNLNVAYSGISMGVVCQVSVSNTAERVSFESRDVWGQQQDMQDMMGLMSSKMSGILWLPQETAEGFLAVTNIGKTKATVQVSTGSKPKTVTLYSRQTQLVKLSDETGQHGAGASLVKLQSDGMPGEIVTTGFVLDLKRGYSSAFTMLDLGLMVSSHLAGAHLHIGKPDQSEGFPEGTRFRSPLLLANTGTNPVQAHVSVDYTVREKVQMTPIDPNKADATEDNFKKTVAVKNLTIAPGDVQTVELSDALVGLGQIAEAGVDIDYDTAPGTLIGHLVSVDQSGDYSFEVPIKDPAGMMEMTDGVYPWTLEDGNKTVLHLKNTTSKPATGFLLFDYYDDAGKFQIYNYPLNSLEPYQTIAIDIQKLIDSQKPDLQGHLFSATATHGQAQWHQDEPYSMIGRAEETNVKTGIAKSFSCGYQCCTYYFQWESLVPGTLFGNYGSTGLLQSVKQGQTCNKLPFGPSADVASSWTSSILGVATVLTGSMATNTVSLLTPGNSIVNAQADDFYYTWFGCRCGTVHDLYPVSATVNVGCRDIRDNIVQEYVTYGVSFIPVCTNFTQTAHSVYFTFSQLNKGDYTWALIRLPLTVALSSGYGLDAWRSNYGSARIANSVYRNPAHNAAVGGAAQSRHMYGDAADLNNNTGTSLEWNAMVSAAGSSANGTGARADFVEPLSGPCGLACTHADWRTHSGSYQQ